MVIPTAPILPAHNHRQKTYYRLLFSLRCHAALSTRICRSAFAFVLCPPPSRAAPERVREIRRLFFDTTLYNPFLLRTRTGIPGGGLIFCIYYIIEPLLGSLVPEVQNVLTTENIRIS